MRVSAVEPIAISPYDSCQTQKEATAQAAQIDTLKSGKKAVYAADCKQAWDKNPAASCALTGKDDKGNPCSARIERPAAPKTQPATS